MAYVDSSALVKLVLDEPEAPALRGALAGISMVTSEITRTELLRAIARRAPHKMREAMAVLEPLDFVPLLPVLLMHAVRVPPVSLRTLDAIQIATALRVGNVARAFFTYDQRQAAAAIALGLLVATPR